MKIIETEIILALGAITPCSSQFLSIGPNVLRFNNQLCIFLEPLEKQKPARITNGVVGKSGRKIPKTPRSKDTHPQVINNIFPTCPIKYHLMFMLSRYININIFLYLILFFSSPDSLSEGAYEKNKFFK